MMKEKRRRFWLIVIVPFVLLFAVAFGLIFFLGRSEPPALLPNPNGYDDLVKAGQSVVGRFDDLATLDHDALRALVVTNAEPLRLVRLGLTRSCMVPPGAAAGSGLMSLTYTTLVLSGEGRLAEMENRQLDAARSYVDCIRLGSKASHGCLMTTRLACIAFERVGISSLVKLMSGLTCEQTRPLIAELQKIDDDTVPWSEISRNENRFMRAQFSTYRNPIRFIVEVWDSRSIASAARERHDLATARLRLLMTEMALRCYRAEQGSSPASLQLLVPKYLPQVPVDPFNGKPLIYQPGGTNWVLYSVGPDRVDDGGQPISSGVNLIGAGGTLNPLKGDVLYDSK